jgi:hypothetical protein
MGTQRALRVRTAFFAAPCAFALAFALANAGSNAATRPAWLSLGVGTTARVDIAQWLVSDEPEAALTESPQSVERNFSDDARRPGDVFYRPIGVRVRVVRVDSDGRTALVHGVGDRFQAYAPIERLVPEIPVGTILVAAGGFGGFADFYPTLQTPEKHAGRIATGSHLLAIATGVAAYDPDSADLVRVRVRALDGNLRGRSGWIAVGYTGLPATQNPTPSDVAEKACGCRLVEFAGP